jgi:hypothetical protein
VPDETKALRFAVPGVILWVYIGIVAALAAMSLDELTKYPLGLALTLYLFCAPFATFALVVLCRLVAVVALMSDANRRSRVAAATVLISAPAWILLHL